MKILFWNVDTQKDFMDKDGKLNIEGADAIVSNLEKLTQLAEKLNIQVVSTGDYHTLSSKELSKTPDFKTTFPEHCIIGTEGAKFIDVTNPFNKGSYCVIYWTDRILLVKHYITELRNVIIYKETFDVFKGNKCTGTILNLINPDIIIVYGVATNICVNFAVLGLLKRGRKVVVVTDAIKELPNLPVEVVLENWINKGATFETTANMEHFINEIKRREL